MMSLSLQKSAKYILEPLFARPIPKKDTRYSDQLNIEYGLIDCNSFAPVFLQVRTILGLIQDIQKETGRAIPHIIRGSAGSSLVCYLLGITQIDPIHNGIELARFMNHKRVDMPDIDIDVPHDRREEIYERIAEHWPGMVARVSNYCKWSEKTALRSAIKEVLRENSLPVPSTINRRNYNVSEIMGGDVSLMRAAYERAEEKEGKIKHFSKHCGGIVIFEKEGAVPADLILKPASGKEMAQLRLNKDDTETHGLIKIDLLSNRGLAQLANICPDRPLTAYPVRDGRTELYFERGWTIGITFGESRGMRRLFMEMRPQNVADVAVALALIRPAAAAEGRKQDFLDKWKVGCSVGPLLAPIIYDDDAITKIQAAIGCDAATADRWRKVFAKGKQTTEFRQHMITAGHSAAVIKCVMTDLQQLVYYSFCKSHAYSYAQLVWALAYWKAHRPHEFWAATLNHCQSEYREWVHYREARSSGLLLSRYPPPYTVGVRDGRAALIATANEDESPLCAVTPIKELQDLGYWTAEEFMPTCGIWPSEDGTCRFRGLIASGRTVSRGFGRCTLICLGVGNRHYIDIVIPERSRGDLFHWAVLEGEGTITRKDTVAISSVKGVALTRLE